MNFVWDPSKAKSNFQKHRVSFAEAVTVFYDPLAKIASDPDHALEEERFILIGHSKKNHLLFVVHVYRSNGDTIRIISARKATKKESRDFRDME